MGSLFPCLVASNWQHSPVIHAQKHYLEERISKGLPYMRDNNSVLQFFVVKLGGS